MRNKVIVAVSFVLLIISILVYSCAETETFVMDPTFNTFASQAEWIKEENAESIIHAAVGIPFHIAGSPVTVYFTAFTVYSTLLYKSILCTHVVLSVVPST